MDRVDIDKKQLYKCEPTKNTTCDKTWCFYGQNRGECKYTTNPEFSQDDIAYSIRDLFDGEAKGKPLIIVQ